jgi:hypothetical protein
MYVPGFERHRSTRGLARTDVVRAADIGCPIGHFERRAPGVHRLEEIGRVFPRSSLYPEMVHLVPAFFMRKVIVPAGTDAGDLKW